MAKKHHNNYRITGLRIRDFMRIEAIDMTIDPDQGLITLGGENAQGKSSALLAIESALTSIPKSIKHPTREGAEMAKIRCTIEGPHAAYTVDRYWVDGRPALKVKRADDQSEVQNPSQWLRDLMGDGFVDPVEFMNEQPIAQRRMLQELVSLDTTEIDGKIEQAKTSQDELEKRQRILEAKVHDLPWHEDAPDAEVSVSELSSQLQQMHSQNNENARVRNEARIERQNATHATQLVSENALKIASLKRQLEEAEAAQVGLVADAETKSQSAESMEQTATKLVDADTSAISKQILDAESINRKVRENQSRLTARDEWKGCENQLAEQIEEGKRLQAEKKRMLAAVEFPVEGLGFEPSGVTFGGQPFSQCSHAEQIRVSVAIALKKRGALCPILIRDASTLDAKSLQMLAEEAAKHDAQVFAEVVASKTVEGWDRSCTFYVDDGKLTEKDWVGRE